MLATFPCDRRGLFVGCIITTYKFRSCINSILLIYVLVIVQGYNRKICQHENNAGSYMDQELADIVPAQCRRDLIRYHYYFMNPV